MSTRERVKSKRVLVVDDEADIRELLDLTLMRMGLEADCAATLTEAHELLKANAYHLCLTDMRLPDGEGLSLVKFLGEQYPTLPVAVITAHGSMENAVAALKAGAFDYVSKPLALEQLRTLVRSALDLPDASAASTSKQELGGLLGGSPAICEVRQLIERVARSQAPVYLYGESGSGKERAARMVHHLGARADRPFIAVNCGAIPENLVESEFFGYRKGAFTGAENDRDGFFQIADGGTLFLDEVADLPLSMQVKFLRAIQERKVRKVGSTTEQAVDVRIICATHQSLKHRVDQGLFRQDLFYRLNVIEVRMPSLRECSEDIVLLAQDILARIAQSNGQAIPKISAAAERALREYSYPGNVRELENILERAMALLTGTQIDVADLSLAPVADSVEEPRLSEGMFLQEYLDQVEKQTIMDALNKTRFNRTAAARHLGVTFRSLRYRMERLGLKE